MKHRFNNPRMLKDNRQRYRKAEHDKEMRRLFPFPPLQPPPPKWATWERPFKRVAA